MESSIQKMRPYDSIGACQQNAADFFDSVDKQRRSCSAAAFSGLTQQPTCRALDFVGMGRCCRKKEFGGSLRHIDSK
jgi:hypothetical protein